MADAADEDADRESEGADDALAYMIARVNRRLEEELARRLRPDGVPIEQFRILSALGRKGPQTMGALAADALVERPTLTKIIDRMAAAGLVFRRPDDQDRRRIHIVMAPEGEALWAELEAVSAAQERELADRLDDGRTRALRALLRELS